MPTKKKPTQKKTDHAAAKIPHVDVSFADRLKKPILGMKRRVAAFLLRRPHRSFRLTRRRDYVRSLKLPGYWSFTFNVHKTLWRYNKLFLSLAVVYGVVSFALVGMASQDMYIQLNDLLRSTGSEIFQGNMGEVGKAGLLLLTGVTGSLNQPLSEIQQIYTIILGLFVWLTTVWLLRAILADRIPRLRDGLYSAGAPILPMFFVALMFIVQLLPVAFALIALSAATASGLLEQGAIAMIFWAVISLLAALSLYWMTSTFIALVVVTLPGMYPMQAIRTAGDLVIGRRLRILFRLLWLFGVVALSWLVIMVPIILFDTWLKTLFPAISWLPIVPVTLLVMATVSTIWVASYVYLLYRRIVDDDAAPA